MIHESKTQPRSTALSGGFYIITLVAILTVGFLFRLYDINWDSNQHLHPDERFIDSVVLERISLPANLGEAHLFDPELSTLNPRSADPSTGQSRRFAYGGLPLYLLKFTGHLTSFVWPAASTLNGLTLVGRALSALFDMATVAMLFLIGVRLHRPRVGLLAAALASLAALHVQLSHFYAVDTLLTALLMATLLMALRLLERPTKTRALLMGVMAGLAVSTKFSAAPVLLACGVACLLANYKLVQGGRGRLGLYRPVLNGALCGVAAVAVFFLFQPYVPFDPEPFVRDISYEGAMVRGIEIPPYAIQYIGTPPVLYQLKNMFLWTAGPALTIAMLAGLGFWLYRLVKRHTAREWVLAAWLFPYLVITLSFQVKFVRYLLPVYPLLTLGAAGLLVAMVTWGRERGRRAAWLATAALAIVVAGTALQSAALMRVYQFENPRVQATRWIYDNVPQGSLLGIEHWDDPLPLQFADAPDLYWRYRQVTFPMYDADTAEKKRELIANLRRVDYIILASNRLYGSIPKVPEWYPISTAYYSLLFQGKLGYQLVGEFTAFPGIGPFVVDDSSADESFTVYDHPKVLIFKRVEQKSEAELSALLPEPGG